MHWVGRVLRCAPGRRVGDCPARLVASAKRNAGYAWALSYTCNVEFRSVAQKLP
jgi:hypothetical protein